MVAPSYSTPRLRRRTRPFKQEVRGALPATRTYTANICAGFTGGSTTPPFLFAIVRPKLQLQVTFYRGYGAALCTCWALGWALAAKGAQRT